MRRDEENTPGATMSPVIIKITIRDIDKLIEPWTMGSYRVGV
jgi:hypothetical protein